MTTSPALQADSVAIAARSSKRRNSSSNTKMAPASGALNAAASPAPAPAARSARPSAVRSLNKRDQRCPIVAPIWTVGPSRPRAMPTPSASTPPTNLTGNTAAGIAPALPLMTHSTCCTPFRMLPAQIAPRAIARGTQRRQQSTPERASRPLGSDGPRRATGPRFAPRHRAPKWNAPPASPARAPTASPLTASRSSPSRSSSSLSSGGVFATIGLDCACGAPVRQSPVDHLRTNQGYIALTAMPTSRVPLRARETPQTWNDQASLQSL